MKKMILILALFLLTGYTLKAQIERPVKWSYLAKKVSPTEATIYLKAIIDEGWHIYSVNQKEGGPVKTTFKFTPSKDYLRVGKVIEPKPITKMEKTFEMNVNYFERSVVFQQKIRLTAKQTAVKGTVEFMVCNDHQCLPPEEIEFSIPVK